VVLQAPGGLPMGLALLLVAVAVCWPIAHDLAITGGGMMAGQPVFQAPSAAPLPAPAAGPAGRTERRFVALVYLVATR